MGEGGFTKTNSRSWKMGGWVQTQALEMPRRWDSLKSEASRGLPFTQPFPLFYSRSCSSPRLARGTRVYAVRSPPLHPPTLRDSPIKQSFLRTLSTHNLSSCIQPPNTGPRLFARVLQVPQSLKYLRPPSLPTPTGPSPTYRAGTAVAPVQQVWKVPSPSFSPPPRTVPSPTTP